MSRYVDENGFPLDGDCESKHTLSDNEIIEGLKEAKRNCFKGGMFYILVDATLHLINRQKAEIERLQQYNKKWNKLIGLVKENNNADS